jgi:hypothetical protein
MNFEEAAVEHRSFCSNLYKVLIPMLVLLLAKNAAPGVEEAGAYTRKAKLSKKAYLMKALSICLNSLFIS